MNQSTPNSSLISNNAQGNSPMNYSRTAQNINASNNINNNKSNQNRILNNNNLYIEDAKKAHGNINYNRNTSGALANSNINNIINRKRNHNQLTGTENLTNLTSQNFKTIDVNEQSFKTPINPKNEKYEFQAKKFKYQA